MEAVGGCGAGPGLWIWRPPSAWSPGGIALSARCRLGARLQATSPLSPHYKKRMGSKPWQKRACGPGAPPRARDRRILGERQQDYWASLTASQTPHAPRQLSPVGAQAREALQSPAHGCGNCG